MENKNKVARVCAQPAALALLARLERLRLATAGSSSAAAAVTLRRRIRSDTFALSSGFIDVDFAPGWSSGAGGSDAFPCNCTARLEALMAAGDTRVDAAAEP